MQGLTPTCQLRYNRPRITRCVWNWQCLHVSIKEAQPPPLLLISQGCTCPFQKTFSEIVKLGQKNICGPVMGLKLPEKTSDLRRLVLSSIPKFYYFGKCLNN